MDEQKVIDFLTRKKRVNLSFAEHSNDFVIVIHFNKKEMKEKLSIGQYPCLTSIFGKAGLRLFNPSRHESSFVVMLPTIHKLLRASYTNLERIIEQHYKDEYEGKEYNFFRNRRSQQSRAKK
jgi:hypothetical protein